MAADIEFRLPTWAPRLSKSEIERLYRSSANGILDEDLIDEVGYGFYARCESMLEVTEILRTGCPRCPVCKAILPRRNWEPNELLICPACDWKCPAQMYQKTHSRKNFSTGGHDDCLREFMRRFRATQSYGEKLVLIDTLIHYFHWSSEQGRPLATAFIEGSMKSTMAFLDRLNYGDSVPDAVHRTREEWRRKWAKNGWSQGRGQ